MGRKSSSTKLPAFGITAAELGVYRYLKKNINADGFIPGGIDAMRKDLDYQRVADKICSLRKKGFLTYGLMQTDSGKHYFFKLKEIA